MTDNPKPIVWLFQTLDAPQQAIDAMQQVSVALQNAGWETHRAGDLAVLAAAGDTALRDATQADAILAPYTARAIRWLLAYGGAEPAGFSAVHSTLDDSPTALLEALLGHYASTPPPAKPPSDPPDTDGWRPWYPVIDFDRCVSCGQCVGFCLFGVYEQTDGQVRVANPQACKNNCPACARMCPASAIIFPKFPAAPINGSDAPVAGQPQLSAEELAGMMDGDLMETLRQRTGHSAPPSDASDSPNVLLRLFEGPAHPDQPDASPRDDTPPDADPQT